jgi:malonyl-CoA/methylmalonyl-CoA synthetase
MANPLFDNLFGKHAGCATPFLHMADGTTITHDAFQPGDRLAAQVEKSPEALMLYAACVQAGVVFLPLNTAYTVEELAYFIEDSGARLVVCDDSRKHALTPITDPLNASIDTLNADGAGTLMSHAAKASDTFETAKRGPDDLAAFLYTSGTTGRSKGAMLTQATSLSNAETLADTGASPRMTCCCTPCRSFTPTGCSWPPMSRWSPAAR